MNTQLAKIPVKIYVKDGFISGLCIQYSINEEQPAGIFDGIYGRRDCTLDLKFISDGRYWLIAGDPVSVKLGNVNSGITFQGIVTNNTLSNDPDKDGITQWVTIANGEIDFEIIERERTAIPKKNRGFLYPSKPIPKKQQPPPKPKRIEVVETPQPTITLDHPRRLIDLE
jgi:hypothetical protein